MGCRIPSPRVHVLYSLVLDSSPQALQQGHVIHGKEGSAYIPREPLIPSVLTHIMHIPIQIRTALLNTPLKCTSLHTPRPGIQAL